MTVTERPLKAGHSPSILVLQNKPHLTIVQTLLNWKFRSQVIRHLDKVANLHTRTYTVSMTVLLCSALAGDTWHRLQAQFIVYCHWVFHYFCVLPLDLFLMQRAVVEA